MNAPNRIRRHILHNYMTGNWQTVDELTKFTSKVNHIWNCDVDSLTDENTEHIYYQIGELSGIYDSEADFRSSGEETGLLCEDGGYYESRAVAKQLFDGTWVGWTYYYGGGKHGEPGLIDWLDDAYDLEVTQVVKTVNEFKRV